MKKNGTCDLLIPRRLLERCRKIVFFTFFLFFLTFPMLASAYAQLRKVSFEVQNVNLAEIIAILEKSTNYTFLYQDEQVEQVKNLTFHFVDEKLSDVLKKCLAGTDLDYSIVDQTVVLKLKDTKPQEQPQVNSHKVSGVVTDKNGTPLPGVTVMIKGTTFGVATGIDGKYVLEVPDMTAILTFTMVGMEAKEIKVGEQTVIDVKLNEEMTNLSDVVVTGIFRRTKELATGASITVTKEDLKRIGNQNVLQSLRTLDPSFKILESNQNGSNPNVLPEIELRGANGIPDLDANYRGNPNQPLFILDGFETTLQRVMDLDPNRVESITLLKDASAAALYGSRSANGVVVIELKAPEIGRLRLNYSGDYAVVIPDLSDYDLLNAEEKLQLEWEADHFKGRFPNTNQQLLAYYNKLLTNVRSGVNTYWLSKPLRTAFEHRHNFEVSGGDEVVRYGINFTAKLAPGVMKGSERDNYQGGVYLSYRTKNLMFKNDLQVGYNNADNSPYGDFSTYAQMNPYNKPNENGKLNPLFEEELPTGFKEVYNRNPLYDATLNTCDNESYLEFRNNFSLEWKIKDVWTVMARFGIGTQTTHKEYFLSAKHSKFANMGDAITSPEEYMRRGEFKLEDRRMFDYSGDLNIRYGQSWGKHTIYAIGGVNISQNKEDASIIHAEGFPNDRMTNIGFAKQYYKDSRPESEYTIRRLLGILVTANYSYDTRYLFDFSFKIDGSSNFGNDNKYAPVWSVGVGWNIHKEKWVEALSLFSLLKIRGSYGVTAAQNFSPFQAFRMYQYNINKQYSGIIPPKLMGLGNRDLKWQQTKKINLGFELGLWDDRVLLTLDLYRSTTSNLLADVTLAPSLGFSSYKDNIGETRNDGLDLSARVMAIRKPEQGIFWNINASLSSNRNKILHISNAMRERNEKIIADAVENEVNTPLLLYIEGRSLSSINAVRSLGIDPATGKELFLTKDNEVTDVWNAMDQVPVGDTRPKAEGILGTTFTWKDLIFSVNFRYKLGGQIYNQTLVDKVENADIYGNVDRRVYEKRWMEPGDITFFKDVKNKEKTYQTSRFVQDENVFSCESASLSYDLKSPKVLRTIGAERLRFTAYINDIFRLSTVRQERGTSYPFANRIAFSINATF